VGKLIEAAKKNRHGQRDAAIILIYFRHGLRASELCELQWSDVEFETAAQHLRRAKNGAAATHPLLGDELRALRMLRREAKSPFIFVSERGALFTVSGLQKWWNAPASPPGYRLRSIPICLDTRPATFWRIKGPIPGRYKATWVIGPSNRPCATRNWHRVVSKIFGSESSFQGFRSSNAQANWALWCANVAFKRSLVQSSSGGPC
jgi:hypothetical protein